MRGKVKTKFISILLIIFILADMFSPYSILLNKSYAADELDTSNKYLFLRRTTDILTATDTDNNEVKYFNLLVGVTGDYLPEVIDLEMKYNTSKLALINSSYKELTGAEIYSKIKIRPYMTEEMADIYTTNYASESLTSIDPSTGRITVNAATTEPYSPASQDMIDLLPDYGYSVPEGYNGMIPIYSIRFKILDSSINASNLTSDLIGFNANDRTPTGISIAYTGMDGVSGELQSLDYVKYDGFVSSENVKNVQTVTVKTNPTKLTYEHGDTIDLAGGKIEITYTDGTKEEVDMATSSDFTLDKTELSVGDTKVTGKFTKDSKQYNLEYNVTVTDPITSIDITTQPAKVTYNQGETIELAGATITPTTKSGIALAPISLPNVNVSADETMADVNSANFEKTGTTTDGLDKGRQRITLTYEGVSKQIDIMVNDTVKSITVQDAKTAYEWGDELDKSKGTVTVTTTSGSKLSPVPFTNGSVTITGYDKTNATTQTLTASYLGKTTTFDVTVTDPVTKIVVDPFPKTTYNPEEALDFTGSYVYEQRKSGTRINKTQLDSSMISGYDNTKTGEQTLTVTFKGKTTTFDITVIDTIKSIKVTGMKTQYSYKDSLDLTNAKVKPVMYSGAEGTEVPLTSAMVVSTFNSNKIGDQDLTIQYEGVQTVVKVNVADVVSSIIVKTAPKTTYKYGEDLNVSNGVITVNWASGARATEETITSNMVREADGSLFNSNVTFPEGQTTVTKPLTISYGGVTTTYNVTIVNEITGIAIKTTPKTEYNVNDSLDVTNGEITITRQVGTEDKAINADWVSGFNSTAAARNQRLTVSYTENSVTKTATYDINVTDQVKSIEIVSQPNKKEYGWGEELDLTGAQIRAIYGSGAQTINITRDMITDYNKEATGHQNLTVSFGGKTATTTLAVTVVDKVSSIAMETYPQQEYKLNGSLNKNGTIEVTRQSGAKETVNLGAAGVTITGFDSSKEVKNQRLTVTYTETYSESTASATTNYDINVLDKIASISVTTKPQDVYNYNDLLSTTDGKVTIVKESGKTEIVNLDDCTVTGYDKTVLGKQTLTVSYTRDGVTKDCTYEVTVNDYVNRIEIVSTPTKTTYAYGDSLDLAGGTIKRIMASGAEITVALSDAAVTIPGKDSITLELGTRVVTVEYAGKTATFNITVDDEIESIVLEGTLKLTYNFAEDFDPNGARLKVITKATSPNGYYKEISADMLSDFNSNQLGTRQLTLKYLTYDTKFAYTINDYVKDIELTNPNKNRYSYTNNSEAKLDVTGGSVRKIMASGEEVLPIGLKSEGVTYDEYVPNQLGAQIINVNYSGFTKQFQVVVRDELVSIELISNPKQAYIYGDNLSINGAQVKVHYLSKTETISLTEDMVSDFYTSGTNALTNGTPRTATISFAYADGDDSSITKTAAFTYTVDDQVEDIILTEPSNKTYYYGLSDEIDLAGGTVQKVMKSGITAQIVDLEDIRSDVTGFISRPSTLGNQTITVNYAGKTKTFTITVKDRLEGIAIIGTPKANYYWGDTLDLNGATLSIDRLKNDETKQLTAEMIDGFTSTQLTAEGTTRKATVTVEEDGVEKTASFDYTIADYISSITSLKKPSKQVYYLNDEESEFDISDGYLVISMASGTPVSDIALTDSRVKVTGYNTSSTGTKAINIEFTNEKGEQLTTSYNIEVKDRLESVTLVGTPKSQYKYGENLDLNGAKLKVSKLSGDTQISITDDMISGFTSTQLTENGNARTVTISYIFDGVTKTATFTYTVDDYIADVTLNAPSKTEYYLGEEIDLSDANLAIAMTSGAATPDVNLTDARVTVTGYDKDKLGTQTITVKYAGFTKTFDVEVKDRLESVTLVGTPKKAYKWGENLNLNGAKLGITKLSGYKEIAITDDMISGFTSTQLTAAGTTRDVTITYTFDGITKTDKFEYTVEDYIIGATLKAPTKVEYNFGTDLALSDAYLIISMASGNSVENVALTDSRVTITGYNKNKLGQQTVKVAYAGFEQSFGIVVVDKIKTVEFNINSIKVNSYKYGENLDLSKATATIENLSGEKTTVSIDNSMISGYDSTKLGKQTVTVTVEGFTSTIEVNVVDYIVGVELKAPTKSLYIVKEQLDLTGGSLKVTMASGAEKTETLTTSMISGFIPTKLGNQMVTVTYEGFTKKFPVQVVDQLADIRMEAMPKTQYKYGEKLDLTGAKLRVTNESDAYEIVNITADMVSGYNPTKLGEQIITVTYQDKTTTFPVIVEDYVKEITFTKPEKTSYKWGEELDLTGAKFTEILASGKVNKVVYVTPEMVTKFNNKIIGKQTLTAMYGDTPGEFQVSVIDDILSMAINNLPNKIEYLKGDKIELAGGKVTIIKDSGIYNFDITEDMISGFDPNALGTQIITVKYQGFEAQLSVVVKEVEQEEEVIVKKPTKKPSSSNTANNNKNDEEVIVNDTLTDEETNTNASENKDKENNNDVDKDITLGVQEENGQGTKKSNNNVVVKTVTASGLGIVALIALVFILKKKNNVKIYEEDEDELILVGKHRLYEDDKVIDISKYVQDAPDKNIIVVLDKNISKKLDKETLKIKLDNEELETVVDYEDGEFEIRIEK